MKKLILLPLLFVSCILFAQQYGTMYVAAKSGLAIRESATNSSKALGNIPYGTKVEILQDDGEIKSHIIENMLGYWQKVKYNNKTGYILDSYLLPWAPPKLATVKEMKQYLTQSTTAFGAKLIVKSGSMDNMEEMGWEMRKQLYKNGAEWHQNFGYEYGSDVYFLPGFSVQQGFLLLRLLPEFKEAIGENDAFPLDSKTTTRNEEEFKIIVDKEMLGDYPWYKKLTIQYADGAYYELQLFQLDNQLVVSFSSGV